MDNICIDCLNSADCKHKPITNQWTVAGCPWFKTEQVIANADRIREMNDVGLAAWYCHDRDCRGCEFGASDGCHLLDWLKAPVDKEEEG